MDQTQRSQFVAGLVVLAGGLLVTLGGLVRLSSPEIRAIGGRELLVMAGLVILGLAVAILGGCEAAGIPLLPSIFPSGIAWCAAVFAVIDVVRIYLDTWQWYGDPEGPLTAVPPSSNWALIFGAVLSAGGGVMLDLWRRSVPLGSKQGPGLSETGTRDLPKTFHANRWWMRDGSGSVLVWDDQAQAWSPWVVGRDPGLPPGWA